MMHDDQIDLGTDVARALILARFPQYRGQPIERLEGPGTVNAVRSAEHTSELQSLMRISYAVFCLKKQKSGYIDVAKLTKQQLMRENGAFHCAINIAAEH